MYAYNHGTANRKSPPLFGAPAVNTRRTGTDVQAHAPTPGYAAALAPAPSPPITMSSRTPSPPILSPVAVPAGCYPIELAQFWRDEYKRGQPYPLHWALFVRTAPRLASTRSTAGTAAAMGRPRHASTTPRGNFYELAGTEDTYTTQLMQGVTFEPDMVADWRGSHVIGWVSAGQLGVFEGVVRQVQVFRHRADWRSQHWVYEVVRAIGGNYQGVFMDGVAFGGLQAHMGKLLDAWERGDI